MVDIFNEADERLKVKTYRDCTVTPNLPEKLLPLAELSSNLWWVWNSQAVELFRRMDRDLWEKVYHNPIKLLGMISQDKLQTLASDNSFISHMERAHTDYTRYMKLDTWFRSAYPKASDFLVAYFSAEFGLCESLPIYAGGLGILSGDHLKSSGDLGIPLVGVGLLYRYGYFHQYLNIDGWQQEEMVENHFTKMATERVRGSDGKQLKISVELPSGEVRAQLWRVKVGRAELILLDTDFDGNTPEGRKLTYELYGGDLEMRISQEILLGIGGVRALAAMGYKPTVYHMNEGHAAFLSVERIAMLMRDNGLDYAAAREAVASSNVFTTHTPVPAGNDLFPQELIEKYLEPYYENLGMSKDSFMSLGRVNPSDAKEGFSMPALALRLSAFANGVSRLHGAVSRKMWQAIWPGLNRAEVPITHITNGIHANTWISYEMASLFDRYIGSVWKDEPANMKIWESVSEIPDAEIWRSHERRRERLVEFVRARLKKQLERRGVSQREVQAADEVLDPEALTIGFARRFATYKRATLIFRDIERLKQIFNRKDMPVQLIVAGKAHPRDAEGKELIKQLIHLARDPDLRGRIVFIEDYDMNVAHYLVQGVDVWLNNPRRPLEASGTSGMKAAVNGVLNLSILDGWWCEGYDGNNGWAIGRGEDYEDPEAQDEVESKAVYDLFEKELAPLFYTRGHGGLPRGWIRKMKDSMRSICPVFNTNRMLKEYTERFYINAHLDYVDLAAGGYSAAKARAGWLAGVHRYWKDVSISAAEDTINGELKIGDEFEITARVRAGSLKPEDLRVEALWGYVDSRGGFDAPRVNVMTAEGKSGDQIVYKIKVRADRIGHCGYALRIMPNSDRPHIRYAPGLIIWK
ncbi:MAG: alpha-glucan phosphorylase [Elusimicrobia bacterium HGW-Elusimicrobia-1]|jgi:starch phosphorylase|nr:MAG: alpha-glucan phosphorylase [Elusimicrobia bacterium HGW-Elusimicrobia-1]